MQNQNTVVIGMSGGVDSSVAALLLREQGYRVIGLFMNNWEEEGGSCPAADDWNDVQNVCGKLRIPCYSVNFSEQYMQQVFAYFLEEYQKGRTPNPDVLCNREIKFGVFGKYAEQLGADYIATGHYCGILNAAPDIELRKAKDTGKDQTYFLNQVETVQFSRVLFPLGALLKEEVRALAAQNGLVNARKKDSTGICFIGERKFRSFLSEYLPACDGKILDTEGREVGIHHGLMFHTLGQRRGLGIGGRAGWQDNRWYVVDKDIKNNILVVSCGEGEELFSDALVTYRLNIIGKPLERERFDCFAKFRYRQPEQAVTVQKINTGYRIDFHTKQRAVTPGQYVVLYEQERCLGGGVIEEVLRSGQTSA